MRQEELSPPRNLHEPRFSHHVEREAAEVFWMRANPLGEALENLQRAFNERSLDFSAPHPSSLEDDDDDDFLTPRQEIVSPERRRSSFERLLRDVFRSCDAYLASYYDFILASQRGRERSNLDSLKAADESRRRSHIALTTNIRVLVRNLKIWRMPSYGLEDFVLSDDMDSKRTEVGNYALHFAFSRYMNA